MVGGQLVGWPTPFELISFVLLVLFLGLRYEVGTDFPLYQLLFDKLNTDDWAGSLASTPQEPGFVLLSLLFKSFTSNDAILFLGCAFLTIAPAWVGFRTARVNMAWALFWFIGLGFYLSAFNVMRQGLAVALVFLGICLIVAGRRWSGLAGCCVAALFHSSAILVLPILVAAVFFSRIYVTVLIGVAVAAIGISTGPGQSLLSAVGGPDLRYLSYAEELSGFSLGTLLVLVSRVGLLAWLWWSRGRLPEDHRLFVRLATLGLPFLVAGILNPVLARVEFYFGIFLVPPIAALLTRGGRAKLIIVPALVVYYLMYLTKFGDLLPYVIR